MNQNPLNDHQLIVETILRSVPAPDVRADFVSRVNARIDATAGWLGVADFRFWTLRLAPAAVALALLAALLSAPASVSTAESTAAASETSSTFSPASFSDWQRDVTGDALLEAALTARGGTDAR